MTSIEKRKLEAAERLLTGKGRKTKTFKTAGDAETVISDHVEQHNRPIGRGSLWTLENTKSNDRVNNHANDKVLPDSSFIISLVN